MLKKAVINTLIYGAGPQIPKFAGILILPIISSDLLAADFGIYGVVQSYVLAFSYLKTLGTDVVLSNAFFKHPDFYKIYWRHIGGFLTYVGILLAVILGFILYYVTDESNPYRMEIVWLNCLPLMLFSSTENLYFRYYQLSQKPLAVSSRVVVTGLINVVITYVTIHLLKMGYRGWFYASFIASLIGFLWMIYPLYVRQNLRPLLNIRWAFLKRSLRVSLPVLPHFYGTYLLNSADRIVLDRLHLAESQIGQYNAAYLFGNYVTILGTSSKKAIAPTLQLYFKKNLWPNVRRLVFYWQGAFLLATFSISIWLPEIIPFVIRSKDIGDIDGVAIWIIMAVNHTPMYAGANSQLFYHEKTDVLWQRALVACSLNILLNVIFVPQFGIYASGVSTFVAYMYLGYSTYLMKSYRQLRSVELNPVFWLLLTIALTLGALVIAQANIYIKAGLSGIILIIMPVFLYQLRKIRRESRRL